MTIAIITIIITSSITMGEFAKLRQSSDHRDPFTPHPNVHWAIFALFGAVMGVIGHNLLIMPPKVVGTNLGQSTTANFSHWLP